MKLARLPDGSPEIFHTLQGEGLSTGKPSIFIRASLCNLHCVWCDTDYTWNWEDTPWTHERDSEPGYRKFRKTDHIVELTPIDVAAAAREFPCRHLVLTGGEPLLQEEEFLDVLCILGESDPSWTAEVETNGTIHPSEEFDEIIDQYNVSPKLANSGNAEDLRIKNGALEFYAGSSKAVFKFVVSSDTDFAEIQDLQTRLAIPADRIILMPEGRTPETLNQRSHWLAGHCRDLGFRFSQRLHINLWGSERAR
jgi:organic radical activating enzyme